MQWFFDIVIAQMVAAGFIKLPDVSAAGFITWPDAKTHVQAGDLDYVKLHRNNWIGYSAGANNITFGFNARRWAHLVQADFAIETLFRLGIGTLAPAHPLHVLAAESHDYSCVMIETIAGMHNYTQLKSPASGKNVGLLFALAGDWKWRFDYQTALNLLLFHSYVYGGPTLQLMDNGDVVSPPTYGNVVGGTNHALFIDNTGKIGQQPSSGQVKENIRPLDKSDDIHELTPVRFDCAQGGRQDQPGLIAEQVAEVMPELVDYKRVPVYGDIADPVSGDTIRGITHYETTDQPEAVRYDDLVPHLLKEIQTLRKDLDELKAEVGEHHP